MEPKLKAELHITSRGWLLLLGNEQHKVPQHEKLPYTYQCCYAPDVWLMIVVES